MKAPFCYHRARCGKAVYPEIVWVSDGVYVSISVYAGDILPLLLHSCASTAPTVSSSANLSNYINLSHTHLWLLSTSSLLNYLSLPNNTLC